MDELADEKTPQEFGRSMRERSRCGGPERGRNGGKVWHYS